MFKCSKCGRRFKTERGLKSHWVQIHGPQSKELTRERRKRRGINHPKYGKKGANQYTKKSLLERNFDTIGKDYKRKYLLEERGYRCEQCGLDKDIFRVDGGCTLEMHHRDNNKFNNSKSNLEILCPNCHALTKDYRNNKKDSQAKIKRESDRRVNRKQKENERKLLEELENKRVLAIKQIVKEHGNKFGILTLISNELELSRAHIRRIADRNNIDLYRRDSKFVLKDEIERVDCLIN